MGTFINLVKNNIRQYTMVIALILAMVIFQIATNGVLLLPMNVTTLILQNAYVFILAVGMMVLLINGGNIDLSVGSIVAFVGAIMGVMMITHKMPLWIAIVVALAIGFLIGAWQAYWVAYVRVPGFIVTLAGQLIFRGLTNNILSGQSLAPFSRDMVAISAGFIPDFIRGNNQGINITAMVLGMLVTIVYIILQIRKRMYRRKYTEEMVPFQLFIVQIVIIAALIMVCAYWLASYEGIPIIFIIIAVLVAAYQYFTSKTVSGRYIYAMGGNEKAAQLSGINTNKVLFWCYVNMGVLAAVAAIVTTSRLDVASPLAGQNYELDAISASFIGGASMYGGAGTIVGAIIGALFMGVLNNGMSILGAGTDIQMLIKGLVLLLAVAFDIFSKSRAKAS
ncbi:MAG: sugar ABC transporter permease [Clostridia bacterium]|nr:sugar ABC transporter permease [Clostridia bacterium]